MEKLYTKEDYINACKIANEQGKIVTLVQKEIEYEIEVLEWYKKTIEQPIYDEEGKIIGYEIIEVDDYDSPIMVEEVDPETGEVHLVQKHHTETRTKIVEDIEIIDDPDRVKRLTCTKRVFTLMLQELGIDYLTQLKPLIETNSQAQLEWDLCIELLRSNPMIDFMASKLGITSEQIDKLFLYANGEITLEEFKAK